MRGATLSLPVTAWLYQPFLSTPSARRATRRDIGAEPYASISIHALREEGDLVDFVLFALVLSFLSTPSARRATVLIES